MATTPNEVNGTSARATKLGGRNSLEKPSFDKPMELVTFYIGKGSNAEGFQVHKEFACYYCPVFNAAFNSQFIEGISQVYRIEDTTPEAFKLLVEWLYKQTFSIIRNDKDPKKPAIITKDLFSESTKTLCQLWVLADRLQLPSLQNMAIDEIRQLTRHTLWVDPSSLHYIYENTADDSLLRQFHVALYALESNEESTFTQTRVQYFPMKFLLDLAMFMRKTISGKEKNKRLTDMERFHVPEEGS